jgi:hypothetical protein
MVKKFKADIDEAATAVQKLAGMMGAAVRQASQRLNR